MIPAHNLIRDYYLQQKKIKGEAKIMDAILQYIKLVFFFFFFFQFYCVVSTKHFENKERKNDEHNSQWNFSSFITRNQALTQRFIKWTPYRMTLRPPNIIIKFGANTKTTKNTQKKRKKSQKRTSPSSKLMRLQSNRFKRSMFAGHLWLRWYRSERRLPACPSRHNFHSHFCDSISNPYSSFSTDVLL